MRGISARIIAEAARFLRWWRAELLGLVPAALRRRLLPAGDVEIRLDEGWLTVERGGRAACADEAAVRRLLRPLGRRPLNLRLPPEETLALRLSLPSAAAENLRDAVLFELERRTPFAAADICCSQLDVRREADTGQLTVGVALASRARIDHALRRLAQWGVRPQQVLASDGRPLEYWRSEAHRKPRRLSVAAAIATALGLAALIWMPLAERLGEAERLEATLAAARIEAQAVAELRRTLDALADDEARLFARKRRLPPAIAVIEELSRLLPDDTWLLHLQLAAGEAQFSGFSAAAAELIPLLDASPLFGEVRFRAPVTRDARAEAERFHLSAMLAEDSR